MIEGFQYYSVLAYSNIRGINVDISTANKLGRRAAKLSRQNNILIDRVRDPRFGQVNAYKEDVLNQVFLEFMNEE